MPCCLVLFTAPLVHTRGREQNGDARLYQEEAGRASGQHQAAEHEALMVHQQHTAWRSMQYSGAVELRIAHLEGRVC